MDRLTDAEEMAAERSASAPRHGLLDRLGFFFLCLILVLCPLPDGSVELRWLIIWGGFAAAALLLLSYRAVSPTVLMVFAGGALVLVAYALVVFAQSLSPGPTPLPIWAEASGLIGETIAPLSASVRDAPLLFLGRPMLAILVFYAGILAASDTRRASLVFNMLIALGCLYGLIGLAGMILDYDYLHPDTAGGALTAFFLNKNTSSTYLGTMFLLCVAMILGKVREAMDDGETGKSSSVGVFWRLQNNRALAFYVAAGLLLAVLIPLAKSRSSLLIVILLTLGAVLIRVFSRRRARAATLAVILSSFAVIYLISGQIWRVRQAEKGLEDGGRIEVYQSMFDAAVNHPWLGLGLGSFQSVFPRFRSPELNLFGSWNIGHSTPLELAFEGGFPLAIVVLAYFALCLFILVRGAIKRPHDPYILGALLVALLGGLHSLVDFPLQIPGYMILYAAITGVGVGRALRPNRVRLSRERRTRRSGAPVEAPQPAS